jgi:hypothetical protein
MSNKLTSNNLDDQKPSNVNYKQTLEESAERLYHKGLKDDLILSFHDGVLFGSKWQQERMYSEEDVVLILEYARRNYYDTGTKWHQEPNIDLTSKQLIKKYYEQ